MVGKGPNDWPVEYVKEQDGQTYKRVSRTYKKRQCTQHEPCFSRWRFKSGRDAKKTVKGLINTIRKWPKRLAWFDSFRKPAGGNSLSPLCPTRWTMQMSSVKSVLAYYESLASYFHDFYISKLVKTVIKRGLLPFIWSCLWNMYVHALPLIMPLCAFVNWWNG